MDLEFKGLFTGFGTTFSATNYCWFPVKVKLDFEAAIDKTYWLDGTSETLGTSQSVGPITYTMLGVRSAKCCNNTSGSYCAQTWASTFAERDILLQQLIKSKLEDQKQDTLSECKEAWEQHAPAAETCWLEHGMNVNDEGTHCVTGIVSCNFTNQDGNTVPAHSAGGTYLPSELRQAANCGGEFKIGSC